MGDELKIFGDRAAEVQAWICKEPAKAGIALVNESSRNPGLADALNALADKIVAPDGSQLIKALCGTFPVSSSEKARQGALAPRAPAPPNRDLKMPPGMGARKPAPATAGDAFGPISANRAAAKAPPPKREAAPPPAVATPAVATPAVATLAVAPPADPTRPKDAFSR
jgi:hypothetical protein